MNTSKAFVLAALAALSLGVGTAMAQETPGGVGFGPYETEQLNKILAQQAAKSRNAAAASQAPQAGSSEAAKTTTWWPTPILQGGDGSGG